MKALASLLIALLLAGCSIPPEKPKLVLKIMRPHIEMKINIEDNFSRFGDNVNGYAVCVDDYCLVTLPEIRNAYDRFNFCTWGVMLGFVVYGDVFGEEKINVCNRR